MKVTVPAVVLRVVVPESVPVGVRLKVTEYIPLADSIVAPVTSQIPTVTEKLTRLVAGYMGLTAVKGVILTVS